MNAIKATWKHGQLIPCEAVDWPEGCDVLVEPILSPPLRIGMDESEWGDDPQSIADWIAWSASLEPLELTPEEEAAMARFDAEQSRFNIEAVRRQMARPQP